MREQDFTVRQRDNKNVPSDGGRNTDVQKDSQSELKIGIGIYEHALLSKFMNSFMEKNKGKVKITCMEEHTLTLIQDFQDGLFDVILCNDSFLTSF